jgi:hypothetical protein
MSISALIVEPFIKAFLGNPVFPAADLKPMKFLALQKIINRGAADTENDLKFLNGVTSFFRNIFCRRIYVHIPFLPFHELMLGASSKATTIG